VTPRPPGTRATATTAGRAVWRSLRSGFATVDEGAYERRLQACRGCEFLVPAPHTLLHALAKPVQETRVCARCGCFVFKKARYATEGCPVPAQDNRALSRWGEPMDAAAARDRP
jgi:hypothetical protein